MSLADEAFPLTIKLGLREGQRIRFETGALKAQRPDGGMAVYGELFRRPGDPALPPAMAGSTIGEGTIKTIWIALDVECVDVDAEVPGTTWTVYVSVFPEWDRIEVLG